jgi:putative membrane protein
VKTTPRLIAAFTFTVFAGLSIQAQVNPLNATAPQTQPNQPGRVQPQTQSLHDSAGAPGDTVQELKDKMFLRSAVASNLAQVQMGELAASNAASADVKELGQKLADDRKKLNVSMAAVADSIGVRVPDKLSKTDRAQYDHLKTLSGEAFDKEYLTCVVRDHHEGLRDFRVESQTTTDAELKVAVDQGAKVLHENLGTIRRLAEQNGVPIPKRGQAPDTARAEQPAPQ